MNQEVHSAKLISVSRLADQTLIDLFEANREHDLSDIKEIRESEFIATYCARVSNPRNQENIASAPRLLRYLMKHKHWSPFEMSNMVVEIDTTRAVAALHDHRPRPASSAQSSVGAALVRLGLI